MNIKQILFYLLLFSLFFTSNAFAETPVEDFLYDEFSDSITIKGYEGSDTDIVIPNEINGKPVKVIGDHAFQSKQLTSVTIPNSVTSIGVRAFISNQLTNVNIPDGVTSIGEYAFMFNQLTSVTIPNSVTSIAYEAFRYNQLTSVTIPENVNLIGSNVFRDNQLTSVIILAEPTTLGGGIFNNNPSNLIIYGLIESVMNDYADERGHTFKDINELPPAPQDILTTLTQGDLSITTTSDIDAITIPLNAASDLSFTNLGNLEYEVTDNRGIEDNYYVTMNVSPFTKGAISLTNFSLLYNTDQSIQNNDRKQIYEGDPSENVTHASDITLDELTIDNDQFIETGTYEATLTLEVISSPIE